MKTTLILTGLLGIFLLVLGCSAPQPDQGTTTNSPTSGKEMPKKEVAGDEHVKTVTVKVTGMT